MPLRRLSGHLRQRGAIGLSTALVVCVTTLLACRLEDPTPRARSTSDGAASGAVRERPGADVAGAAAPPKARCGSAGRRGPSEPPSGAVVVDPGDNLYDVVNASPPSTTFWLRPGVHTLDANPWGQVIPKDGDTFIGAPGAVLDGRKVNRYAFTGRARRVAVKHLTIQHFGTPLDNQSAGVVNHDSGRGWTIAHNLIRDNGGAGAMLGSHGRLVANCLTRNGQYGFQVLNARRGKVVGNEIAGNNTANWEDRQPGCGCAGGAKVWNSRNITISDNWIHHNHGPGLWADTNNAGVLFKDNHVADNDAEGLVYELSYNARIVDNTFVRNGWGKGPTNPGFPTGAIYVSESGSDRRVPGRFGERFVIARNVITDNWSGVIVWENADRFAGSPSNTSTGYSTLVDPDRVNLSTCTEGRIDEPPQRDDCRWKSTRIRVTHNQFRMSPTSVPRCRPATGCGYQGLFSNWGTTPEWSPYLGDTVQQDIVWHQDNLWKDNDYEGPWRFMVLDQATVVGPRSWRRDYGQDVDSRLPADRTDG